MGEKVIPVMITTVSALENALSGDFVLLYLDAELYERQRARCDALLKQFDCRPVKAGKKGFFFQRALTEAIRENEIYDPLQML